MPRFPVVLLLVAVGAPAPVARSHPTFSSRSIVNAASFLPAQSKGGAIARGSIFTIFGGDIGPKDPVQATTFPLEQSLGRVRVVVAQPGLAPVFALPLFVSEGQINAIMPSDAPLGAVTIQVEFSDGDGGSASSPVRAEVVAASFGIFTATGRGVGPSIAFNFEAADDQPLNATTASARPGQTIVLWGTGLGAVAGGDDRPPGEVGAVVDLQAESQVEVWVGGARAERVLYAGRASQFAGLDQINFVVPDAAAKGCYSPVWVRVAGGRVSNVATLAISDAAGRCQDPLNPYLGPGVGTRLGVAIPQRVRFEAGGVVTTTDTASASFRRMAAPGFFYNPALSLPPRGTCLVFYPRASDPEGLPHERPVAPLEAGTPLVLSGPGGSREVSRTSTGFYESLLEGEYLQAGGYTLQSAGAEQIPAFEQPFEMGDPPTFRLNGDGVTVPRDQPLTVNWTGGDPQTDLVRIMGVVSSSALVSVRVSATFICTATPGQGILQVPVDILSNLPVSIGSGESSTAKLYVGVSPMPDTARFETNGLDFGAIVPVVWLGRPITVQ